MRFLILFFLLAPLAPAAQPEPYYLADGLNDFSDQQFRGTSPLFITNINNDSLIISTSAAAYEHASFYKRLGNEPFLRRISEWETNMPNFAIIFGKAVMLVQEGGSYLLFLKDKDMARQLIETTDKTPVLHTKDSLVAIIVGINTRQRAADEKAGAARNQKVVTAYIHSLGSKRSDPALTRDIINWSHNETTKVYIMDANYYITRNYRGEVLNKNIPAIIRYKTDGHCYIQWRAFGYEAIGGGNFVKDLYTYNKSDYYLEAKGLGGSLQLEQGVAYPIDCD